MSDAGDIQGAAAPEAGAFDELEPDALIRRYRLGSSRIERRLLNLRDEQLDTFFLPEAGVGRLSCRALVGHLADAEVVFVARFRRTVAEDGPILPNWDQDAFLDAGLYGRPEETAPLPPAGSVAVVHTLRLWAAEWLETLDAPAWRRKGLHPSRGEMTLRQQVAHATWHLEHHVWFLTRKLEKLLGPAT